MILRAQITMSGIVQGVGFRPFVYRLAGEEGIKGWVANGSGGVTVEAEGDGPRLQSFLRRIENEAPPNAFIQNMNVSYLTPFKYEYFEIRDSDNSGRPITAVPPDLATCTDCLAEVLDPRDRRFRYPFANCTRCGPRFTILETVPYDRPNTGMKTFSMCRACRSEYENPEDRRFHAQPIACPGCGPRLVFWDASGGFLGSGDEALRAAAAAVREGRIVAVKGLGGFHLFADASDERAVRRLRERKRREEKPLAVMFPSLESVRTEAIVSDAEARLLSSPAAPIVLLRRTNPKSEIRNPKSAIALSVAPNNPYLGVLLPYTPLHHLLMREIGGPVVATSGNRSEEPIATDEHEAVERLRGIADLFLVHDRPIVRQADDSVARVILGEVQVLRLGRGYAPLAMPLSGPAPCLLAVGGHLKNTVALSVGDQAFLSQHIGDLSTPEAVDALGRAVSDLKSFRGAVPESVVCDAHPDYASTHFAETLGLCVQTVQHHHAHIASCMAEHGLEGRVLGAAWDGSGYGPDGTVWGGEFLVSDGAAYSRAATFRPFGLPGGEAAVREPRRAAVGLLFEIFGAAVFERNDLPPVRSFSRRERRILLKMLEKGVNVPRTSSAGRLFDAVAAIAGHRLTASFEGQAAMEWECAADLSVENDRYPYAIEGPDELRIDWEPMIRSVLGDRELGTPAGVISAKFHNTLAEIISDVAVRVGQSRVVLTGGCFQNRILTERAVALLKEKGFSPYWHRRVPPNDGGIALGQIRAAAAAVRLERGGLA